MAVCKTNIAWVESREERLRGQRGGSEDGDEERLDWQYSKTKYNTDK